MTQRSKKRLRQNSDQGRYAYQGLDRVLHEKARLGILTSLATNPDGLLFVELKEFCELTDGKLSRHLAVLQDAEIVEIWKGYRGKKPQTLCRISETGRARFLEYISVLESVVEDGATAQEHLQRAPRSRGLPEGWSPVWSGL